MLSLPNLRSEAVSPADTELSCAPVRSARSFPGAVPARFPRISPISPSFLLPICIILLVVVLIIATPAHAQGCTQCLDSTRATPPAVQAAYRHAIYLMIGVASTLFLVGVYLLRRNP